MLLLAALKKTGTTKIELAAYEPHVMNLVDVLREAGADIALRYDHTIIIKQKELLKHLSGRVIGDYLVGGTLAIIGALTAREYIDIHDARIEDLSAFLFSIDKM